MHIFDTIALTKILALHRFTYRYKASFIKNIISVIIGTILKRSIVKPKAWKIVKKKNEVIKHYII
jgi:hypothetical protein